LRPSDAMEKDTSGAVLGKIEKTDGEMHSHIKIDVHFRQLVGIDDRGIQALFRGSRLRHLAVALRGSAPDFRQDSKDMSKRRGGILKDDMEARVR